MWTKIGKPKGQKVGFEQLSLILQRHHQRLLPALVALQVCGDLKNAPQTLARKFRDPFRMSASHYLLVSLGGFGILGGSCPFTPQETGVEIPKPPIQPAESGELELYLQCSHLILILNQDLDPQVKEHGHGELAVCACSK